MHSPLRDGSNARLDRKCFDIEPLRIRNAARSGTNRRAGAGFRDGPEIEGIVIGMLAQCDQTSLRMMRLTAFFLLLCGNAVADTISLPTKKKINRLIKFFVAGMPLVSSRRSGRKGQTDDIGSLCRGSNFRRVISSIQSAKRVPTPAHRGALRNLPLGRSDLRAHLLAIRIKLSSSTPCMMMPFSLRPAAEKKLFGNLHSGQAILTRRLFRIWRRYSSSDNFCFVLRIGANVAILCFVRGLELG